MKIPDFFKIRSAQDKRNRFPLRHTHLSTTDFFRLQPVVCREVVPGDSVSIDVESFVRFFPMPFPTFGSVRYYNRFFFVPYRLLMEGFNNFITSTPYPTSSGHVIQSSVPFFYNNSLCSLFVNLSNGLSELVDQDKYFVRPFEYNGHSFYVVCDSTGRVAMWRGTTTSNGSNPSLFYDPDVNYFGNNKALFELRGETYAMTKYVRDLFGFVEVGASSPVSGSTTVTNLTSSKFHYPASTLSYVRISDANAGRLEDVQFSDFEEFSSRVGDFVFEDLGVSYSFRFTNKGRIFYQILTSLGYRVDFRFDGSGFSNDTKYSAGKLLSWVKIYIDYFRPSQYENSDVLDTLFSGVNSNGREVTISELKAISNIMYSCYEHDYFTAAWDSPNSPNGGSSVPEIVVHDVNRKTHSGSGSYIYSGETPGNLYPHTPAMYGNNNGTTQLAPTLITKYIVDALTAVQDYLHRNQLSGFRAVDRYLARYGRRLSDDRGQRSYYLGSNSYSAMISDVMSTAETGEGALADYAGKGMAYSDRQKTIKFDSDEYGFIMVVSSVIPDIGYVQGVMRENHHLGVLDFHTSEFDNLGVQAIRQDEVFADCGMYNVNLSKVPATSKNPSSVFGFAPRYSEYKIGYDFLTGDFVVPSRRQGMDAYHLYRLFDDDSVQHDIDFCYGEQSQYDRIFNNVSDEYDHMYIQHVVNMNFYRPMKSISEVVEFETGGQEIEVPANGTQLS